MAKKKKTHKKPGMKIPLLTVAGLVPGISNMHRAGSQEIHGQQGYLNNLSVEASRIYLGFDSRIGAAPKWNLGWCWEGSFPILIGAFASKIASKLGVNKMFKGLPIRL